MTQLTPPNHLVDTWTKDWQEIFPDRSVSLQRYISTKAADWQLKADAEWVEAYAECGELLRNHMRPKPKSLAEEAIKEWGYLKSDLTRHGLGAHKGNIEAALERLKELDDQQCPNPSPIPQQKESWALNKSHRCGR